MTNLANRCNESTTARQYCQYLPVRINNTKADALIDCGNIWRSAISKKFFTSMGFSSSDITNIKGPTQLATANEDSFLTILGEPSTPLSLRTRNGTTTYTFLPIIIDGLSMPINISGPWMLKHNWDHIHSKSCLLIDGQLVPMKRRDSLEVADSKVHFLDNVTCRANSATIVGLSALAIRNAKMPPGDAYLRGNVHFMNKTKLHPALNAIVACEPTGELTACVLNTTHHDIRVKAGQIYGNLTRTCHPHEQENWPWRISTLHHPDSPDAPPSAPTKTDHYKDRTSTFRKSFNSESTRDTEERKAMEAKKELAPVKGLSAEGKRNWLFTQFELDTSDCLQTKAEQKAAIDVLYQFWPLFSHDGSYGKTDLLKHRIITDDALPIKCKYRPINPALEPSLRAQIDEWVKHDVIEPSNSPWSANLVAAKKKGGKVRWCVDWRRLNAVTRKDSYPMPTVQDNMARLAGSTIFSGVDMAGAFHCVEMDKRDKEKTAFSTPFGSYQQKRLGFGVTNGPATYCRLVERVLKDIPHWVAIGFMDDGVIHSKDVPSHVKHLRMTLQAYGNAGLRLNPKKCTFFKSSMYNIP
jgi:hypothetical protein